MTPAADPADDPRIDHAATQDRVVQLVARLTAAHQTVATAESLTGGLVVARLIDCPGASVVVRGGIVAYDSEIKARLVGVDTDLLAAGGAVQAAVAEQLAQGARRVLQADWGIGTTGVAGPDPSDGQPVGTVHIAVCGPEGNVVDSLALEGDRATIRRDAVDAAVRLLSATLTKPHGRPWGDRVT